MKSIDLDHARARVAHQIAAGVHTMLAEVGMTIDELKDRLARFPRPSCTPETVDLILTATSSDKITMNDLSDIAWALGFEWSFHIQRWPEPEPEAQP